MSVYAISDLHGCREEFHAMLEKIAFSEYDEMYIIGDVCDRGKESIALLQDIMSYPNMHLIFGNHDVWLAKYTDLLIKGKKSSLALFAALHTNMDFITWMHYNGGVSTADQFMDLSFPECYDIKVYLDSSRTFYKTLEIMGRKFLLVHSGLGSYCHSSVSLPEIPEYELVWPHIGLDDNPFDDVTMIVGHMPTFMYGDEYDGRIAHGKRKSILHIDCGCVFGRALGCVRLNDMEEFYVSSTYPRVG